MVHSEKWDFIEIKIKEIDKLQIGVIYIGNNEKCLLENKEDVYTIIPERINSITYELDEETKKKKLESIEKAKLSLKGTLYGMIIRTISLFIVSYLNIGLWSLIIATSINIIFVTGYDYIKVKQELKNIP